MAENFAVLKYTGKWRFEIKKCLLSPQDIGDEIAAAELQLSGLFCKYLFQQKVSNYSCRLYSMPELYLGVFTILPEPTRKSLLNLLSFLLVESKSFSLQRF